MMIHIEEGPKLIFVRGVHTMAEIEEAFLETTGKKRFQWRAYTIVGLADDNSKGLETALPFSPPEERREIGFRLPAKKRKK